MAKTREDIKVVEGNQITIPKNMTFAKAREWLERKEAEEEQTVTVDYTVNTFPLDGAFAFMRAMKERYGWTEAVPTPTWFGPKPPALLDIEIGPGQHTQVVWGRFAIPGIAGWLAPTVHTNKAGQPVFGVVGEVKTKHKEEVTELVELTRQIVTEHSIYKGKAVRMTFPEEGNGWDMDANAPNFLDTEATKPHELVFNYETERTLAISLFTPIERTAACRNAGIPLKRGILLEGPYGTGKTMTAAVTAKKCVENGWTYLYVNNVTALASAIEFARQYAPCVIFAEDIDRATDGDRDEEMDSILNTLDGVDAKGTEIITVLTTNNLTDIHQAMLRPGRLDAVVSVRPPDAWAVGQLLRLYARGLLDKDADLHYVSEKLAGNIPAVIREVVERAKLAAVARDNGDGLYLTTGDLNTAAASMLSHLALLNSEADNRPVEIQNFDTCAELAGEALGFALAPLVAAVNRLGFPTEITGVDHPALPAGETVNEALDNFVNGENPPSTTGQTFRASHNGD